jgi:hypothetical protein
MFRYFLGALAALACVSVTSAECLTTLPASPAFVPPAPYSSAPRNGGFWFGTDSLWAYLSIDGTWNMGNNVGKGKFYRTKLQFGRELKIGQRAPSFVVGTNVTDPPLTVTAKRLDDEAPLVFAERANPLSGKGTVVWVTAINIPTIGCWGITAQYKEQTLSYVVSVEP